MRFCSGLSKCDTYLAESFFKLNLSCVGMTRMEFLRGEFLDWVSSLFVRGSLTTDSVSNELSNDTVRSLEEGATHIPAFADGTSHDI